MPQPGVAVASIFRHRTALGPDVCRSGTSVEPSGVLAGGGEAVDRGLRRSLEVGHRPSEGGRGVARSLRASFPDGTWAAGDNFRAQREVGEEEGPGHCGNKDQSPRETRSCSGCFGPRGSCLDTLIAPRARASLPPGPSRGAE
ncbi:hypothetical protein NDU88_004020 [Pleurodeles waltl]|uniref:Uncharacterized protein n=1 Tax=Pleurodeles waltl TaxID=8319 RepID=A0AAV7SHQ4_PLEWA|nr:hypothetical protein NDU88_004020 [Pleurodeles waltl]